jgi:hypothetical protein
VKSYAETGKGRAADGSSLVVGKGRDVVGISKLGKNLKLKLSVTVINSPDGKIFTGMILLLN